MSSLTKAVTCYRTPKYLIFTYPLVILSSYHLSSCMADYKVLFVCMGNICRSPAGEGVLKALIAEDAILKDAAIEVDSAGTIGFHDGAPPDTRMRAAAAQRGYTLTSRARRVTTADLKKFDLVLAMDKENLRDLQALQKGSQGKVDIRLFCDFCQVSSSREVPDPYYGGADGFETVLDLLEDGCQQLIVHLRAQLQ